MKKTREAYVPTRLFRQRLAAGMTQENLAARGRTVKKVISQIEHRHKTAGPKLRARIAQALNVQTDYLFDDTGFAVTEQPVKWKPNAVERKVIELTRQGYPRTDIGDALNLTGYEVWRVQRDAGLLPLYRGGGKP